MRDTDPEFERFVDAQYRRLSAAVRVRLCTAMFDGARALIESGLDAGMSEFERRRRVTARLYGVRFADTVLPRTG